MKNFSFKLSCLFTPWEDEEELHDLEETLCTFLAEVTDVAKKVSSGKVPRVDEICAEILRAPQIVG